MKRLLLFVLLAFPCGALADAPALRRFAVLVGVNDGGGERIRLRYAVSDAESFGRVLSELGGVEAQDRVLLSEPRRQEILTAMSGLRSRIEAAKKAGQRTEAILYYSGHSDDQGLLIRGETLSYGELRRSLDGLEADVRIAVLDSCSSGTAARRKGGVKKPAFLLDQAHSVRGQVLLTSSSSDEASQESDRLGGSYFTHHLVSGLRGAADSTRDGRITLTEAYQFAFNETLSGTEDSRAGPQHPTWDIDLVGTGDVVLTDLRSTRSGLAFAAELEGRLFVRDGDERLVAELRKAAGEASELAVAPGRYVIVRERDGARSRTEVLLVAGGRSIVASPQFTSMPLEATVSRGSSQGPGLKLVFGNLGIAPLVGTNELLGGRIENRLSFGLISARAARVNGLAFSGGANWIDEEAHGVRFAGATNLVPGNASGVAVAGALNFTGGEVGGVQFAGGANLAFGNSDGVQVAGGFNGMGEGSGAQLAGGMNYAGRIEGLQMSGGMNYAGRIDGLQMSGGMNYAGRIAGAQVSVLNVGGEVGGAQIGVINIGSRVRGLQLGVINLGGEVEGASVGLLSFVKNGQFHVEAWGSDLSLANVGVKFGSKHVYTMISVGAGATTGDRLGTAGLAIGGHIPFPRWFLDVDLGAQAIFPGPEFDSSNNVFQLRAMAGLPLAGRFSVIGGPSLNMGIDFEREAFSAVSPMPSWEVGRVSFWPGVQLGLRF